MPSYNRPMLDAIINHNIASETFSVLSYTHDAAKWAAKGDNSMSAYCKRVAIEHLDKLNWLYSKMVCADKDKYPRNHVQHMLMYAGTGQYRSARDCKQAVDSLFS